MTTKPDLSPESIRELLQASSVRRRFGEATPLVRALLEEIVRLRQRMEDTAMSIRSAPFIGKADQASIADHLTVHRNRALPQDPPEET